MSKKFLSLALALLLCMSLSVPAMADETGDSGTSAAFTDVAENSPFKDAIAWAVEQNITKGITDTTFGPGNICTVSQVLTFLYRATGSPSASDDESASVSAWAGKLGMDTSNLGAPCTRAAAMEFLWKATGSPRPRKPVSFTDVDPGADYADAVTWAVNKGVAKGTGEGVFSPDTPCTRGQIVTFLYRDLVEITKAGFSVETNVRLLGTAEWGRNVDAKPGDEIEFQIQYLNRSGSTQENVEIHCVLAEGLSYVKGSTVLINGLHPEGLEVSQDAVTANGIAIGAYQPGAEAYVRFRATVADSNADGSMLVSWGQSGLGEISLQDYVTVVVNK